MELDGTTIKYKKYTKKQLAKLFLGQVSARKQDKERMSLMLQCRDIKLRDAHKINERLSFTIDSAYLDNKELTKIIKDKEDIIAKLVK